MTVIAPGPVPLRPAVPADRSAPRGPGRRPMPAAEFTCRMPQSLNSLRSGSRAGRRDSRRLTLTHRGRVVAACTFTALAVAVLGVVGVGAAGAAQAARSGPSLAAVHRNMREIVVRPGDTLWAIATRAQPTADPQATIQEIIEANALPGVDIQPGERLWVPRG
jgi:hypothetical protein